MDILRHLDQGLLRGMAYLDHRAGMALDYGDEGTARALLLDYARYAQAGALQDFGAAESSISPPLWVPRPMKYLAGRPMTAFPAGTPADRPPGGAPRAPTARAGPFPVSYWW